ncbi:MAG: hypothetical protein RBG13Loki_3959 [Promethearchaeota archaeon CR_4]|nr:MAG: hypothetical protein RBG13Loki_3959 [Candidatus Lokiarchaeota archaeon CR_4]
MAVLHGQKVHDSNFHIVYLTADLVSAHYSFTIFVTSRVEGFPVASYLPEAPAQVKKVTEPRLLIFDGEFPTVELLSSLEQLGLPWNARKSFTKSVRDALAMYARDPMQLERRCWHITEIKDFRTGKGVHVHVAVQKVHEKLKAISKPI